MGMSKKLVASLQETNKQVFLQSISLINSAFALVAALAWNDAIKAGIDRFFPSGSGLYSHVVYAVIVTAFVVVVTGRLNKLMIRFNEKAEEQLNDSKT